MSGASSPAAAAAAPGAPVTLDQQSTRDSFIPLFDGTPSGYQEWRKRITIYSKKMELMKRTGEAVLNLLGSLQGTAWKLVEDYDLEKADKPGAFAEILMRLDKAFKYDSKVEMPADFAAYFEHGGRKANQTLLQFITDHDDKLRKIEKHGVSLPKEVQGYQLLSKANITKEQKQLIMTHAKSLERDKIQEALFTILGQDYRSSSGFPSGRWSSRPSGKGRGYYADDPPDEMQPGNLTMTRSMRSPSTTRPKMMNGPNGSKMNSMEAQLITKTMLLLRMTTSPTPTSSTWVSMMSATRHTLTLENGSMTSGCLEDFSL